MEVNDRRQEENKNANSILLAKFTASNNFLPCELIEMKKNIEGKWKLTPDLPPIVTLN